ncbi:MAG: cysteine desulfurase family protein [Akkermansia sp.]|nr:cysteine desulfurase family protein [Akkermansia sp.]
MLYWDNNATTAVAPEVLEAMLPYLREECFNPSAAYGPAKRVRRALQHAREQVAALIGAQPQEIVFTSGGTEAANTALHCFTNTLTLATEHPATLRTAAGDACPVLSNGLADVPTWKELLPGHDGASFAWANHETGVVQPVHTLAQTAREAGARVHVDLVQAAGKVPVNVHEDAIDFASLSAHKIHGPKGAGALYLRNGATLDKPLLTGGDQEGLRRAGTENVPGIIGFGKAAELALAAAETYAALAALRDRFAELLRRGGAEIVINGAAAPRLPHVLNLRVPGVSAESLLHLLEPAGLLCSGGSACTSSHPEPSHVLTAMGLSDTEARESLRFSISRHTTAREVEEAAAIFLQALRTLQGAQSDKTGPVMVYR